MLSKELATGIFSVGSIDWNLRTFHGYRTDRGSSYNSYLILDDKIALIDTVKSYLCDDLIKNISEIIDPSKIDYLISNHVEMDHSGSISRILELAPQATVITSVQGEKGLRRHFKKDWRFKTVKTGDSLELGRHKINFYNMPMVHWPDSMASYLVTADILFSNDAFGQHIAGWEAYDDQIGWTLIREEAAKYYANIVMPYGDQVKKVLSALDGLDISMICPSHGKIWRKYIPEIIKEYSTWADYKTSRKALIVYDSMWGSTEKMAFKIRDALQSSGLNTAIRSLSYSHISDVITDVLDSKLILLGSPTLNGQMLPTMGAFITYLKGLKPRDRLGFAFGSYGWGGQAAKELEQSMLEMKWQVPLENINIKYIPDDSELESVYETALSLVEFL